MLGKRLLDGSFLFWAGLISYLLTRIGFFLGTRNGEMTQTALAGSIATAMVSWGLVCTGIVLTNLDRLVHRAVRAVKTETHHHWHLHEGSGEGIEGGESTWLRR